MLREYCPALAAEFKLSSLVQSRRDWTLFVADMQEACSKIALTPAGGFRR